MPRMRFPEVVKASSAVVSGVVGSFFQESRQIFSLYFSFSMSRSRSYKSMSRMKFKFPEVVRILSWAFFEYSADKSFPQDKRQGILWLGHISPSDEFLWNFSALLHFIFFSSLKIQTKQSKIDKRSFNHPMKQLFLLFLFVFLWESFLWAILSRCFFTARPTKMQPLFLLLLSFSAGNCLCSKHSTVLRA